MIKGVTVKLPPCDETRVIRLEDNLKKERVQIE